MKLREWLLARGIKQSEFAETINIGRAHLSCIISGHRKSGRKTALSIEKATEGAIKAEDVISGVAVGYEGKRLAAAKRHIKPELIKTDESSCKKVFSLI